MRALSLFCLFLFSPSLALAQDNPIERDSVSPPLESAPVASEAVEPEAVEVELEEKPAPAEEADLPTAPPASPVATPVLEEPVSLDEIRRFVSVFRAVKQAYVEPIDDTRLMRAAIRGLLSDLDPHSAYLDASQTRDLNESSQGAYDGLGLEVVQNPDRTLTVISPIDDTPAARAGIRPGDVITAIDGAQITAENVDAAVESMRGEPGSKIELTLLRADSAEPITLTLVRETIVIASVRGRLLEPGFGYLRVAMFQADTAEEIERILRSLSAESPLRGLVLDLRSNPGGLLLAAVETADLFLDRGLIVSTKGRLPQASSRYNAHRGDALKGAPIIALIDGGTASAAEVLGAALRDHKRALLMGDLSFGKGSVQTVLPIDNGDSIKLTTSRYYSPSGASIQASGLVPDIKLPDIVAMERRDRPPSLRERDLPGHLRGDAEASASSAASAASRGALQDDYLVQEALQLLRGLALFNNRIKPDAQPVDKGEGP